MKPHDGANDPAPAPAAALRQAAVYDFFLRYAREFNRGLHGDADMQAMSGLYTEAFIGAAPAGVMVGHNDTEFARVTAEGFRRYRDVGMRRMELEGVTVVDIDALHALASTEWNAVYAVEGGEQAIRFTNAYLVRADAQGALKVFGWITGDEAEAMRMHGIPEHSAKPS